MTALFRRILTGSALAAMLAGFASADTIIGYTATLSSTSTDITDKTLALPAWNPGGANSMLSTVSGNGYTAGISMASLDVPGMTYTLVGYNILVKESLQGQYTITNNSTNSAANGTAYIDTYTAVALDSTLAPPLTNTADPANDLFNCSKTGVGLPSSSCGQGEQISSPGGGPDPNAPLSSTFNIAANGGTFTSAMFNVNSKWVDYGCEVTSLATSVATPKVGTFCTENATNQGATFLQAGGLLNGPPDLTFDFSTATQTTTTVTGGNLSTQYATFVTEQVSVTYDYIATSNAPEPTTMALMGGALLGLGLLGKRFKKS